MGGILAGSGGELELSLAAQAGDLCLSWQWDEGECPQ